MMGNVPRTKPRLTKKSPHLPQPAVWWLVFIFAIVVVLALSSTRAVTAWPVSYDSTQANVTVNGTAANNALGASVAYGDVNGDGYDDLIAGAYGAGSYAGRVYVFFGGPTTDLNSKSWDATSANVTLSGTASGDELGVSVASGDLNNDGYSDLIIGALSSDPNGQDMAGQAYVFFGGTTATLDGASWSAASANVTISGTNANDYLGSSVASGDVNGDSYDDLIIGAYGADSYAGQAYVFFGGATATLDGKSWSADSANVTLTGTASGDYLGYLQSVASGDVNHDTYSDLIIGAPCASPNGISTAGQAYVFFGGTTAALDGASWSAASTNVTINGTNEGDYFGWSVASGDVNNDGYSDLIIGADGASPNGQGLAGQAYVFFGGATATLDGKSWSAESANVTVNGTYAGDGLGASVSSGDVNGDGYSDLIIGALSSDPNGQDMAGQAYVFFGGTTATLDGTNWDASSANVTINGTNEYDDLGYSVAAGDVNGDTYSDLIIGALGSDPNGQDMAGQAYVFFIMNFASERAILLVDDDAGSSYETYYTAALDDLGRSYDYWNNADSGPPSSSVLSDYGIVIWETGDDYAGGTTISGDEQTALASYLDGGGSLFISGQYIGWASTQEVGGDPVFLLNYLRASYITEDGSTNYVLGYAGDPVADGWDLTLTGGDGAGNSGIYSGPDIIAPINDSVAIANQTGTSLVSAVRYIGTYRLVYLSFPFESIDNSADRDEVMYDILLWLTFPITVQSPLNQTYDTASIWANVTLDEDGYCNRSLDGGENVTMSNITWNFSSLMTVSEDGAHNVTFFCNSTNGDMNSITSYFSVSLTPPTPPAVGTIDNYVCDSGETRALNPFDCCPSVKNYICEDYIECGSIDPDCIALEGCAGSKNEYNQSIQSGYGNSKNLCYPGYCLPGDGGCWTSCDSDDNCTSGFCVEGECVTTAPVSDNSPSLSLASQGVVIFEGEDIQIPYTIANTELGTEISIDSIRFEGMLGRFFKPEVKRLNVIGGSQETVKVDVDSFELSQMFIGYLSSGRYQVVANFSGPDGSAADVLDVIVLPTFMMQNTKSLPPQRTIGHILRQTIVNDTETGRILPVEVKVWVW